MDFVGLEKLSLVDYDEHIACTLFTSGCNFKCSFCHNGPLVINPRLNIPIPFSEILAYLKKREGILDGVVISGGEPTLMDDLKDKIIQIKNLGYDIKLDTNGTRPEIIKQLLDAKLINYIAMDIKSSLLKYSDITDSFVNLDKIKQSIALIMNSGIDYEFRTTLIKEFHDLEDIKKIGELIKGAKKYRLQKFVDREGVINHQLHEVDFDTALTFVRALTSYCDDVELRGY